MPLVHLNSIAALDSDLEPIVAQTHVFVDISEFPDFPQQQTERIVRPGVDGIFYRKTGVRGEPFEITTKRYLADLQQGLDALEAYRAFTDLNYGVQVTQHSIVYAMPFQVLKVREVLRRPCVNAVGVPGAQCYHVVQFVLEAMDKGA